MPEGGTKCNIDQNSEGGVTYVLNYTHKYSIDMLSLVIARIAALKKQHLNRRRRHGRKLIRFKLF